MSAATEGGESLLQFLAEITQDLVGFFVTNSGSSPILVRYIGVI